MKIEPCVRCGRALKKAETINESGDPAVIAYTVLKTTGIRPRATATAKRRSFCMPCAVSIAFGPSPESGAFSEDVYQSLVDLVTKAQTLHQVAWEQKINPPARPRLMPGSQPDKSLEPPVLRGPIFPARQLSGTG